MRFNEHIDNYIIGAAALLAALLFSCLRQKQEPTYDTREMVTEKRFLGDVGWGCDTCVHNTPPQDTIENCCSFYNAATDELYNCYTANGDCQECYLWCEEQANQ